MQSSHINILSDIRTPQFFLLFFLNNCDACLLRLMEIFKDRKKIIEFTDKYCFGNVAVILRNYPDKLIMFGNSFVVANQSEPGSLDPEIDF